jgi:hypothetical protein
VSTIAYIETFTAPLDRARRSTFRWAAQFPTLRALLYRRDRRIALQATLGVVLAFAMTTIAPVATMAVSPIVFGVPHLASDVRYLVLRQQLPRWWVRALVAGCAALFALRLTGLLELASLQRLQSLEMASATLWIAGAAVAGAFVSGAWRRLAFVLPALAVIGALATRHAGVAMLVFAHLHNVVAIGLWLFLFRRHLRCVIVPLGALALALIALLSGATMPLTAKLGGGAAFGLDLGQISTWFTPDVAAHVAVGLTLSYIFLQSIHYAVWMGWIPQEQLPGQSTMSWRASLRSLANDLGERGFWIVVALVALVLGGSLVDLHGTRKLYLSLAVFHGYLELAMLCYLVVARRARGGA